MAPRLHHPECGARTMPSVPADAAGCYCAEWAVDAVDPEEAAEALDGELPELWFSRPIEIHLNKGKVALVDADNLHLVRFNWTVSGVPRRPYAARSIKGKKTYLHHVVLPDCPPGMVRDHINGDTLDNRRANLRIVSRAINARNHARLGGIRKKGNGYEVRIRAAGHRRHVGTFATEGEARAARLAAEEEAWGIEPRRAHFHREARSGEES